MNALTIEDLAGDIYFWREKRSSEHVPPQNGGNNPDTQRTNATRGCFVSLNLCPPLLLTSIEEILAAVHISITYHNP